MPRVRQLGLDQPDVSAEQRDLLEETRKQLGKVPNLYAAIANSPAVLRGYLALREALAGGALSDRAREQLALLIAHENRCGYCVAAHTLRGSRLHSMSEAQLRDTRQSRDEDPHTQAVLQIAQSVLRTGGRLDDALIERARLVEITDEELMEIVGHVALNVLSNYANHVAQPDLDFPPVELVPDTDTDMGAGRAWRHVDEVELVEGYYLRDGDGADTRLASDVEISIEGGFVHLRRNSDGLVQTFSAPAVRRITAGHPTATVRRR